nr:hypothetical protein Iba_chr10aCG16760 [Ipomoea batatas]
MCHGVTPSQPVLQHIVQFRVISAPCKWFLLLTFQFLKPSLHLTLLSQTFTPFQLYFLLLLLLFLFLRLQVLFL